MEMLRLSTTMRRYVQQKKSKAMLRGGVEEGGRGEEEGEGKECPFLSSDVDCIVTKAFNFSILLIELDQTGI
jgi:hypothetical protein